MRLQHQVLTPVDKQSTIRDPAFDTQQTIAALVHFGAGQCSELDAHLALRPAKLLLVDADPQLTAALQTRTCALPSVQILCNAIAGNPGPVVFHRYNLPGSGGLHAATGLLQLFPGLKLLETITIEAVSPAALLEPLQLAVQEVNVLIIDLAGEELPVLQALWEAKQLHLFSWVKLRCGREPLYEGGESAARLLDWLAGHGFDLLSEDDSDDPDCPCWILQRNAIQLRNVELTQQLADLKQQLSQSTQTSDAQAGKLAEQEAQLQQASQTLEQANQGKAAQEKLAAERQAQIQQLTQSRDEQIRLAGDSKSQVGKLQQERDAATKQLAEQKSLVETKHTEINNLQVSLREGNVRVGQLEAQLSDMEARQCLLGQEMVRAEGQIDLIKDLLLRETRL